MRSPVIGSLVNKFKREVPVNRTVQLSGTECIMGCTLNESLVHNFSVRRVYVCIFWCKEIDAKAVRNLLAKLIQVFSTLTHV